MGLCLNGKHPRLWPSQSLFSIVGWRVPFRCSRCQQYHRTVGPAPRVGLWTGPAIYNSGSPGLTVLPASPYHRIVCSRPV